MGVSIARWSLALLCLLPASAGDSGKQVLDEDLWIEPVVPRVWRHVSHQDMPEYGRIPANGLLVIGEDSAAMIDTPWTGEQTARLFEWVENRYALKIRHVVPTHSHGDCMGGLSEAHRRGAVSYASELTAEFARREGDPVPQETFSDRRRVPLGGVDLELRFLGGGHTRDNIVVWLPQKKVLFGGCLVKRRGGTAGYTDEADLEAWPSTLRTVMTEFPRAEVVVPGHGKPGSLDYVEFTIELAEGLARDAGR